MSTVLIIRGIQEEVATPVFNNVPYFFCKFSDRAEGKKEHILNQPKTAPKYMVWMSLQDRQGSEVCFFPSGKKRPRWSHERCRIHLWEANGKYHKFSCKKYLVHWNRSGHIGLYSQSFLSIVFSHREFQEQRREAERMGWRNVAMIFQNQVTDEVTFLLLIYVQETECLSVPWVLNIIEYNHLCHSNISRDILCLSW